MGITPLGYASALAALLTACGAAGGGDASVPGRWSCPVGWREREAGGCAPTFASCGDGGAECANPAARVEATLPSGGVGEVLRRAGDGSIVGAWPALDFEPVTGLGAPEVAWAPDAGILTCPAGWPRQTDGTCDPRIRDDCPAGALPLPGGECTATSESACPAADFAGVAEESAGSTVVHVLAGADPALADGSLARPFAFVTDGIRAAGAGGWVLVGRGDYAERVVTSTPTHVVGVCAARVALLGPAGVETVSVAGVGATLDLRGVTVRTRGPGVRVSDGGSLTLRNARIDGAVGAAVEVSGRTATLVATDVALGRTSAPATGMPAAAIHVVGAARARVERCSVVDALRAGIHADGSGTTVQVRRVAIRGVRSHTDMAGGDGLLASGGATLVASEVFVGGHAEAAALCVQLGSHMQITDAVMQDGRGLPSGLGGYALWSALAGALVANRVLAQGNPQGGVVSGGTYATLDLFDSVVRNTRPRPDGHAGIGLSALDAATLNATRVIVDRNLSTGALAAGGFSVLRLTESIVRETRADVEPASGFGVSIEQGASATIARSLVARNRAAGVIARGRGSLLAVSDSLILDTQPDPMGYGYGLEVGSGALATISRARIERSQYAAIVAVDEATRIALEDSVVAATVTNERGTGGNAVEATMGAVVSARRTRFAGGSEIALVGSNPHTTIDLADCVVQGTLPLASGQGGWAMAVNLGASASLLRTLVRDERDVAIWAADPGTRVSIADSVVRNTGPRPNGAAGTGIEVRRGATVAITRVRLSGNTTLHARVTEPGTRMDAHDVLFEELRFTETSQAAIAVSADLGGQFTGSRIAIVGGRSFGLIALNPDSRITLRDSLVSGIEPSTYGFGVGAIAATGGTLDFERVVVEHVSGAGIAASDQIVGQVATAGAFVRLRDVLIDDVRSSTVSATMGPTGRLIPSGAAVAYGIHASSGCSFDGARVVVDRGGYGFYSAGASFALREAVVTRQLDGVGVAIGDFVFDGVLHAENANESVQRSAMLPSVTALSAPTPISDR